MDMVYIPTESIQMALEQFGDISGTATTTATTKTSKGHLSFGCGFEGKETFNATHNFM